MSSILTNTSSMVALQTLKGINKGMAKVQDEISTGLKVSTAKDNSSSWSIASTMNSDVGSYKKLGESLTSASALVGVARTAAEQVGELVKQIQTKVVQAQNPDADVVKLTADVTALAATITSIAASAQYNGINLVNTGSTAETITVAVMRDAGGALTAGTFSTGVADLGGGRDRDHRHRRHQRRGGARHRRHPARHGRTPPRRPSVRRRPGSRRRTPSSASRRTR